MSLTRDQLVTLIDELETQRLRGIRSVSDEGGERIEYSSDREMAAALAAARRQLATLAPPITTIRFKTSKGLWI